MEADSQAEGQLIFDRVTFTYDQGDEIFRDVTFSVKPGDFCFISGESGAGKSTLLKLIYGANTKYLGSVKVFGQEISELDSSRISALRRRIGIVFQEFELLEHLTVLDNVAVPLILDNVPLAEARDKANQILSWLGLGSYLHKAPKMLSGGQRQRVAAARAVVHDPEIIIADEPTGHVDHENATIVMKLLHTMKERGKTVFMATHNMEILSHYQGRHFELKGGQMVLHEADRTRAHKSLKIIKEAGHAHK